MSTTSITSEYDVPPKGKPGAQLADVRAKKGYSIEYVANKLHLRVRMIELLEADDYQNMPEPVFIKGYLRAYARLLDLSSQPLLDMFNRSYDIERKVDKALWQNRREINRAEHAVKWFTAIFACVVVIAVALWWQTNKDNEHLLSTSTAIKPIKTASNQMETEIRLTDLSKMRSILSSSSQDASSLETQGG